MEDIEAWQRGQIVFRDVALPEALAIINRCFQQQIKIADQSLASDRLSGTITYESSTAEAIVSALQAWDERILWRRDPNRPDVIELLRKPPEVTDSR